MPRAFRFSPSPRNQYPHTHGPAHSQCTPVLCPIRTGSHLRAHPGQDCRLKAEGSLGRRPPAPRYAMKDGKIAVVEDEAERVRLIHRRYLELRVRPETSGRIAEFSEHEAD